MYLESVELCAFCSNFVPPTIEPSPWREHHPSLVHLRQSAHSCRLCDIIYRSLPLEKARSRFPALDEDAYDSSGITLKLKEIRNDEAGLSWATLEVELTFPSIAFTFIRTLSITTCDSDSYTADLPIWKRPITTAQDKIHTLKSWIQICLSKHSDCHPIKGRLPKRLIDVGSSGHPPKLVMCGDLHTRDINYATLSHRWGGSKFRTTKSKEGTYLHEIPWELIPVTLQDALLIARAVNIPYLWIDSLCIVQDDLDEWQIEASMMQDIYAGSSLTIAATDASNSSEGCFLRENSSPESLWNQLPELEYGFFVPISNSEDDKTTLVRIERRDIRADADDAILNTRGWVLQEMVLSHRTAHFMRAQLHWKCRCELKTESGAVFDETSLGPRCLPVLHPRISRGANTIWWKWMQNYSRRQLTFPMDKLPALAGIVQHYHRITGHTPILGLWRQTLHQDLLWMRIGDLAEPAPHLSNIPSWSWLSCNAPIRYDHWNDDGEEALVDICDHTSVVSAEVTWTSEPFISDIMSSRLVIEGPVKECTLSVAPRATDFNPPYLDVDDEEPDFESHPIPWRCAGQCDQGLKLHRARYLCLLLRSRVYNNDWTKETFLILESCLEASGHPSAYRRVGLGNFRGTKAVFELKTRQIVHLV